MGYPLFPIYRRIKCDLAFFSPFNNICAELAQKLEQELESNSSRYHPIAHYICMCVKP